MNIESLVQNRLPQSILFRTPTNTGAWDDEYNAGRYFNFVLNINHVFSIERGEPIRSPPLRQMVMQGRASCDFTLDKIGIWYDESTGRYFGFIPDDPECLMYQLRE